MSARVICGDCREVMGGMEPDSVDSIVTDPPYHLTQLSRGGSPRRNDPATPFGRTGLGGKGFMGKAWDGGDVAFDPETWRDALRVLRPGGHLLAFGGSRTYHRLGCAIEDAGFEVRDQVMWLYGSGFPKSRDVSKAIDKAGGDALAWRAFSSAYGAAVKQAGFNHTEIDRRLGLASAGSNSCYWARTDHRGGMPPRHHWARVKELLSLGDEFDRLYDEAEREVIGQRRTGDPVAWYGQTAGSDGVVDITAPATDAARRWAGWGTALKPAHEPLVLARKPLGASTVAANVLAHGTGALAIDKCRVMTEGQQRDADAYRRLYALYSDACNLHLSHSLALDALRGICVALRSCSTDGRGHAHGAPVQGGIQPDRAEYALLADLLFPNGAWCGRATRSVQGSLADCPVYRRFCDEHAHRVEVAAQDGVPSLLDALVGIVPSLCEASHIRSIQRSGHLSSCDDEGLLCSLIAFLFGIGLDHVSYSAPPQARWPSNVLHDGSEEVEAAFAAFGERASRAGKVKRSLGTVNVYDGGYAPREDSVGYGGDTGTASRFFYCAKAGRSERWKHVVCRCLAQVIPPGHVVYGLKHCPVCGGEFKVTAHPTQKPESLMRYLCRLITPPGGTVLDMFAGSGSTGCAALAEGFGFVGIEADAIYAGIAEARIAAARVGPKAKANSAPKARARAKVPPPDLFSLMAAE